MWSAKINASTAKYEAPDEVDPVVTLNCTSLKRVSAGLSSGLALGRLIQCSLSRRISRRVSFDLRGWVVS